MESGIFARGGRRADEKGGCRIRNPTKKTGLAERCGAMSNFRGEATNFRGEAPGDRGEATNFRGEAPGDRGEAPGDRGEATNFRGEPSGNRGKALHRSQWACDGGDIGTYDGGNNGVTTAGTGCGTRRCCPCPPRYRHRCGRRTSRRWPCRWTGPGRCPAHSRSA